MGVAKNISTLPPEIISYKPSIKKPTEKPTKTNKNTQNTLEIHYTASRANIRK